MKIEVNIGKKHLVVFLIGVFVIISGIFVYAQVNGGVSHAWDEITGRPNYACSNTNEALKTINLGTGAVTCEVDDAGGTGGLTSVSWNDIQGKPFVEYIGMEGTIVFITNSYFIEKNASAKDALSDTFYQFQVRYRSGWQTRVLVKDGYYKKYDSGWKTGNYELSHTTTSIYDRDAHYNVVARVSSDAQNKVFVLSTSYSQGPTITIDLSPK